MLSSFRKPLLSWWEPSPWLFGVRHRATPWREAARPFVRAAYLGSALGCVVCLTTTWTRHQKLSLGLLLFSAVLFALLFCVLTPLDLLLPALIQVTDRGLRRVSINGRALEYLFEHIDSYSIVRIESGTESVGRLLVIKLRFQGDVPVLVPARVSDDDLRRALSNRIPECAAA